MRCWSLNHENFFVAKTRDSESWQRDVQALGERDDCYRSLRVIASN